jgi:hypothetical protein
MRRKNRVRAFSPSLGARENLELSKGTFFWQSEIPSGKAVFRPSSTGETGFRNFSYLDFVPFHPDTVKVESNGYLNINGITFSLLANNNQVSLSYDATFPLRTVMPDFSIQRWSDPNLLRDQFRTICRKAGEGYRTGDVVTLGNEEDGELQFYADIMVSKVVEIGPGSSGWLVGDVFLTKGNWIIPSVTGTHSFGSYETFFVVTEVSPTGEILKAEPHPGYYNTGGNLIIKKNYVIFNQNRTIPQSSLNETQIVRDGTSWPTLNAAIVSAGARVLPSFVKIETGICKISFSKTVLINGVDTSSITNKQIYDLFIEHLPKLKKLSLHIKKTGRDVFECHSFRGGSGKGFTALPSELGLFFVSSLSKFNAQTNQIENPGSMSYFDLQNLYTTSYEGTPNPSGGTHGWNLIDANKLRIYAEDRIPVVVQDEEHLLYYTFFHIFLNVNGNFSSISIGDGYAIQYQELPSYVYYSEFKYNNIIAKILRETPTISAFLLEETGKSLRHGADIFVDRTVVIEPLPAGEYPIEVAVRLEAGIEEIRGKTISTSLGTQVVARTTRNKTLKTSRVNEIFFSRSFMFMTDIINDHIPYLNPDFVGPRLWKLIPKFYETMRKRGWL